MKEYGHEMARCGAQETHKKCRPGGSQTKRITKCNLTYGKGATYSNSDVMGRHVKKWRAER